MTAVNVVWGPASIGGTVVVNIANALTGTDLNGSAKKVAWRFCVPKDGTISEIGFYVKTVTGTPPSYKISLETTISTGYTSGTNYGGSSPGSYAPASSGWHWTALETDATAVAGDVVNIVFQAGVVNPDDSNYCSVAYESRVGYDPFHAYYYTTIWLDGGMGFGPFAIRYGDGTIYGFAMTGYGPFLTLKTNTTPDEVGCRFTLPGDMKSIGAVVGVTWVDSNASYNVVLYDDNDTILASWPLSDEDIVGGTGMIQVYWDEVSLSAETIYRLVMKPTSASLGAKPLGIVFENAEARQYALPEGENWQYTERTDGGAWTDVDNQIVVMGLIISDITFGHTSTGGYMNGADVLLLVNTGTQNSPTYTAVGSQRGVSFKEATAAIDMSSKDSRAARVIGGRYSAAVSLNALYVPNDTAYLALKTAMRDGDLILIRKEESGVEVEEATALITSMSNELPDQAEATIAIELTIDGEWSAVGS